jgi:uncharacterized protein (TIRG00374 family)
MSNTSKMTLGLLVGVLTLGVWLYVIGFRETLATLSTVTPGPAIVATLAWCVSLLLRSYKWHAILATMRRLPFVTTTRVYWASSFLNVLFPLRVGELARSLFLKRLSNVPISTSLPTVLVDRLYSIAVILIGLLFLPLTSFRVDTGVQERGPFSGMWGIRWGIGLIAAGFFVTLVLLFVLRNQKPHLLRLASRLLAPLPAQLNARAVGFLDATIESMQFVRSDARTVLALIGLSLAVLVVDALKDHFVLNAFGLDVPVIDCFFGVCITNLAFILPSPPGNIGSNEWYATLVYSTGFGYNNVQVASGALFGHLMTTLVVAATGALSLSSLGITLAEGLNISQHQADVRTRESR